MNVFFISCYDEHGNKLHDQVRIEAFNVVHAVEEFESKHGFD